MIRFTNYARQKFELLNSYKVFLTKEQVEEAMLAPDKIRKKGRYVFAEKNGIGVIFSVLDNVKTIITFYPVK